MSDIENNLSAGAMTAIVAAVVGSGVGDMQAATYDVANIAEQVVGLTSIQTITNKILTSPTINTATISNPAISGATITGGSVTGITDLAIADGGTGASDARTACANLKGVYILGSSAVAVSCGANTTENTLATITVPANAMGANGILEIITMWTINNNANTKTERVYFGGTGGTKYYDNPVTTAVCQEALTLIQNRNSASSQVGFVANSSNAFSSSTSSATTSALNTALAQDIVITGTKAVSGDTLTLERYIVRLMVP